MGVYIKSMEMPKNCSECVVYMLGKCRLTKKEVVLWLTNREEDDRPQHCPLAYVPPHGRLGDLDKLAEYFDSLEKEHPFLQFSPSAVGYILRDERYTPIIIPAEEERHECRGETRAQGYKKR